MMRPEDYKRRLLALAPKNGGRAKIRAEVPTAATDGNAAVIRLYDPVDSWGWDWGVSAKEFVECLDNLPASVDEIHLHINSPGGEVFEAIAIVNALRNHPARVVATVDGIAASAASFIAASADELVMARNSELMIHDAWGVCVGNAGDMKSMADMLDHVSDNIASIYAAKAGEDVAVWRQAMTTETWYSADEAVAAGLADSVAQPAEPDAKNRFDLSVFTYAGREAAPAPEVRPAAASDPDPAESALAARINEFRHLVASTRV
jgi:ATP-dependent Clp endopeptidase proteolytic subunit ClpP